MTITLEKKDLLLIVNLMLDVELQNDFSLNDEKTIEKLLDFLSDKLMNIGLDENDEPNELGVKIESLIDKLSDVYYS